MLYEGAYTNLQRVNIEYDYLHGVPIKEILQRYGICRKALYNALDRWNVNKKNRLDKKYHKVITSIKYGGMTTREAAEYHKVSIYTVWRICRAKKFNLHWRVIRFTEERKKKMLAENLGWRKSNNLFYEKKWQTYKN